MDVKRWLVTIAAGYAGAGAVTFLLYRAAYSQTRDLRTWTEQRSAEVLDTLGEARATLDELRRLLPTPVPAVARAARAA